MKTIRRAVYRQQLEAQLSKYERRIQKIAEQAYRVRQVLENMIAEERQTNVEQKANENVQRDAIPGEPEGTGLTVQSVQQNAERETMPDVFERAAESEGAGSDTPAV